jgi:ribosomal protein S18 acetylase RimI-like enzyme
MTDVRIETGSIDDVPTLRDLWVAVHRHHEASMPQLAPYVGDDRTWEVRSELYRDLLGRPGSVLLVARDAGGTVIGYGVAFVSPAEQTWLADTWVTGSSVGEIESLAVAPEQRGRGVGSRLLDGLHERLSPPGADDVVIGVLPGNEGARRLYESKGYTPTWLYLSRLKGR